MLKYAMGLLLIGMQTAAAQATPPYNANLLVRALSTLQPADPTVPLTERERFRNYLTSTVGPLVILSEAAGAGINQWTDSPHEWGQGGSGYGKRLGNNLAYNTIRTTVTYGTSALFREDNRYFAAKQSSFKGRIFHALISPAVCTRGGRRTVSFSSLSGIMSAPAISQAWAPPSWRGADNWGANVGITYASLAGTNVVREFVPGIIRRLRK